MTICKTKQVTLTMKIKEFESTDIVHIGTKDGCSILTKIGERNYKALWDSGAGKCVISYDKYKTIPEKLKTHLFPSKM